MVCLLAAPWVQLSISVGNGWPHNALRHHWLMPVSCHLQDCKSAAGKLLAVSGTISSVLAFTFYLYFPSFLLLIDNLTVDYLTDKYVDDTTLTEILPSKESTSIHQPINFINSGNIAHMKKTTNT